MGMSKEYLERKVALAITLYRYYLAALDRATWNDPQRIMERRLYDATRQARYRAGILLRPRRK